MGVIENYLDADMNALLRDGAILVGDSARTHTNDFSYIVFPYAKLYEGFLKKLFFDTGIIDTREYQSDHFRIGKALSPNLSRLLGAKSAYTKISDRYGNELAARLWHTWKEGRNLVFHYFPHNFRRMTREGAIEMVERIKNTMKEAVAVFGVGE